MDITSMGIEMGGFIAAQVFVLHHLWFLVFITVLFGAGIYVLLVNHQKVGS